MYLRAKESQESQESQEPLLYTFRGIDNGGGHERVAPDTVLELVLAQALGTHRGAKGRVREPLEADEAP